MSEENKPVTPDKPEDTQAQKPAGLDEKRKRALLVYMAVLFSAAFILVLLSFLIQLRDSRATISSLSEASQSALANAQQLQSDNAELQELVTQLQQELADSAVQTAELEAELELSQAARSEAEQAAEDAEDRAANTKEQLTEAENRADAYRYLSVLLRAETDYTRAEALKRLEPLAEFLDADAYGVYQSYRQAAETAETDETDEPS